MLNRPPQFHLARVYDDGRTEAAEILPVTALPWETRMGRRGLLATGLTAAAALAAACGPKEPPASAIATTNPKEAPNGALRAHRALVDGLTVAPNGVYAATATATEIKLWNLAGGTRLDRLPRLFSGGKLMTFSSDARTFTFGVADGTVWRSDALDDGISDRWSIPRPLPVEAGLSCLTATPGRLLAVGETRGEISLRWLTDGRLDRRFSAHSGPVTTLAVAPNGALMASAAGDSAVKIWRIPEGTAVTTLDGQGIPATAFAWSADSALLATAEGRQRFRVWNVAERRVVAEARAEGGAGGLAMVMTLADGRFLGVLDTPNGIDLWLVAENRRLDTLKSRGSLKVAALAATPDGKTLLSGQADGTVILWDLDPPGYRGFLFDPTEEPESRSAAGYRIGEVAYTQLCGAPIPPGATCTCNCVPGTYSAPVPSSGSGGGSYCPCNKVCVCIPVV